MRRDTSGGCVGSCVGAGTAMSVGVVGCAGCVEAAMSVGGVGLVAGAGSCLGRGPAAPSGWPRSGSEKQRGHECSDLVENEGEGRGG